MIISLVFAMSPRSYLAICKNQSFLNSITTRYFQLVTEISIRLELSVEESINLGWMSWSIQNYLLKRMQKRQNVWHRIFGNHRSTVDFGITIIRDAHNFGDDIVETSDTCGTSSNRWQHGNSKKLDYCTVNYYSTCYSIPSTCFTHSKGADKR